MKVKKLLTLLILSSVLVACGSNTAKSSSSAVDQSSAPDTSSVVDDSSSSSDEGSSSSTAPSSSEDRPSSSPASSSSEASSSSQASSSSEASSSSSSSSSVAPTVTGISLDSSNVKKTYLFGDALNLTGLVVKANYNDGSSVNVTNYTTNPANGAILETHGSQTVVVTYETFSADFAISVSAVVTSISVTAPTKTEYTTNDEQLDLAGMVVTANYSDGSSQTITEGFEIGDVDFSSEGEKDVTVTYQGKSDSFKINVTFVKPTAWTAAQAKMFSDNLHGYVLPFFYGPDQNVGELEWKVSASDKVVYAIGGELEEPTSIAFPFRTVYTILKNAGFVAIQQASKTENPFYIMDKEVEEGGNTYRLRARFGAVDPDKGTFETSGVFYFEIEDGFLYSWADSGFEAKIQAKCRTDVDIPDLPAPAMFLKLEAKQEYIDSYYSQDRIITVSAYGVDEAYANAYIAALEASSDWDVSDSSREGLTKDAMASNFELRMGLVFDKKLSIFTVIFDAPRVGRAYLNNIAALLNIPGGGYAFEEDDDGFIYATSDVTVDTSATTEANINAILDTYGPMLNGHDGFALKGSRSSTQVQKDSSGNPKFTYVYEQYVSESLGAKVYLYGIYNSSSSKYTLQVEAMDYVGVPSYYLPVIEMFGLDPDSFNAEAGEGLEGPYVWTQKQHEGTLDEIIKIYTDILDADTTFGFKCDIPVETVTMSSGGEGRRAVYSCEGYKVELYAFNGRAQIAIYEYHLPAESAVADAALAVLEGLGYKLTWESSSQFYSYANHRELGAAETIKGVTDALIQSLLDDQTLDMRILSNVTDTDESVQLIFSDNLGIYVKYSTHYGDTPVLFIKLFVFEQDIDLYAALVGLVMAANMKTVEEGKYEGYGEFNWTTKYNLYDEGKSIMELNIGKTLADCLPLEFSLVESHYVEDEAGNYYIGTYTNADGYKAEILLYEDASGNYAGYYKVIVYAAE